MDESHEIVHARLEAIRVSVTLEKILCFIILQLSYVNIAVKMNIMTIPFQFEEAETMSEMDTEQPKLNDLNVPLHSSLIWTLFNELMSETLVK